MKYFKTSNELINRTLYADSGNRAPVFTIMDYAKAFNISRDMANKRIKNDPEVHELSKERALELGALPPSRSNGRKYDINGEMLTLHQISVRYNIPASTIKKWESYDRLENEIIALSISGYHSDLVAQGPSASVWKVSANGRPAPVNLQYIQFGFNEFLDDEVIQEAQMIYEESKNSLAHFYNTLRNVFNYHVHTKGGVLRQVKLQFLPDFDHRIPDSKNAELVMPEVAFAMNAQYRTLNCVTVDANGVVHFITLPEFERRISGFTYDPAKPGSDPTTTESLLADYRLNPGVFSAVVEMSVIGRANNKELLKTLHAKTHKHPYYVLMDSARPISKNSCFFDSIKLHLTNQNQKVPLVWNDLVKKYSSGVGLDQIETIANVLGINVSLYGNPIELKENLIGVYGPQIENSLYSTSFRVYFHEEPEPHFSALIGVRSEIYSCTECLSYFSTKKLHDRHKCFANKRNTSDTADNSKLVLYYDVETVNNLNTQDVEVYSVSFKWSDQETVKTFIESDREKNALKSFCKEIEQRAVEEDITIKLVAFNGSSFDIWAIIKELKNILKVTSTLIRDNRFYTLTGKFFNNPNSKLNVWDPFLYFRESLNGVAKSFGLSQQKQEFDHFYIQNLYDKYKNFDFITGDLRDKIIKYNEQDVRILEQIVEIMRTQIPGSLSSLTASSYAYKQWKPTFDQSLIENPKTKDDYKFIRSAVVGGRVQTLHKFKKIEGDFVLIDVVSLYPSQMYDNWFPIGPAEDVIREHPDCLGIYECEIQFQNLPCIVPLKTQDVSGAKLNWEYTGKQTVVISSVIIDLLRKTYGFNSVKVGRGKIWRQRSKDVFKNFINHWMAVKTEQDVFKDSGDAQYNPVLRQTAKLMLNSVYGKTVQRVNTRQTYVSTSPETTRLFKKQLDPSTYVYEKITDGLEVLTGDLLTPEYESCKPQQLGVFVLDYTKRKMYEEIYSKCTVYYSDTDSALITRSDLDRLVSEGVITIGKVLGNFDIELENITEAYLIAPKCYALVHDKGTKMKLKGVSVARSGWSNTETGKYSDHIDIDCYKQLIDDRTKIKFHCSQLVHRKSDMTMYMRDIDKIMK